MSQIVKLSCAIRVLPKQQVRETFLHESNSEALVCY
jgi:hypothetical protein